MITALACLAVFSHSSVFQASAPKPASCCDPGSMVAFLADPKFMAAHEAPLPFKFRGELGKDVTYDVAGGASAHAYYVAPQSGAKSAIVLVHEWWGLNNYIKREAEQLQRETGYAVLALDLYDGKVASTPADAGAYMRAASEARDVSIVEAGLKALKSGKFGFKPTAVGSVGYCFGGGWSHRVAILGKKFVKACVIYYGMPDTRPASLADLSAPVLMFEGRKDAWINDKVVADFSEAMKKAGKSLEVHAYDADHAFANPSNPHYDQSSASDAHAREIAFFKSNLP